MAKNPQKSAAPTKKHQARLERERQQIRWVIICSSIVLVLVVGTILAGIINEEVIKPNRVVAVVNGEKVRINEFVAQAGFSRAALIENAKQTYQFMQYFGNDPNSLSSFVSQLQQIQAQLDPTSVGQSTIERLISERLISQEAKRRGISLKDTELNTEFQNILGYFPEGTPTSEPTVEVIPTSTLNPLQLTAVAPTATPVITATATLSPTLEATFTPTPAVDASTPLTPTATLEPTPSPTPYTEEGYKTQYQQLLDNYGGYGVLEKTLKEVVVAQTLRERVKKLVLDELAVPRTREETWARHILVADVVVAQAVLDRLNAGEDWCKVAAEVSIDTSNKDNCGDLGWFPRDQMVAPFSESAFTIPVGEKSGAVETEFGQHIIWVLGRENHQISDDDYKTLQETRFTEWLQTLRDSSEVTIQDNWQAVSPAEPTLPDEIMQFLVQWLQQQQQQQQPSLDLPTAEPTPEQ